MRDDREIADETERGHARPNMGALRRRINARQTRGRRSQRRERDTERLRGSNETGIVAGKSHLLATTAEAI